MGYRRGDGDDQIEAVYQRRRFIEIAVHRRSRPVMDEIRTIGVLVLKRNPLRVKFQQGMQVPD